MVRATNSTPSRVRPFSRSTTRRGSSRCIRSSGSGVAAHSVGMSVSCAPDEEISAICVPAASTSRPRNRMKRCCFMISSVLRAPPLAVVRPSAATAYPRAPAPAPYSVHRRYCGSRPRYSSRCASSTATIRGQPVAIVTIRSVPRTCGGWITICLEDIYRCLTEARVSAGGADG